MSWFLQGPFPLDLSAIQSSTRVALDAAEAALRAGLEIQVENDASPGNTPGLYIVWTTEPRYLVAGFWVVVGANWMESEDRPGERAPPFVRELLDAATEEVWWQNLEVHPREGNTWRPVIVVEWPPELSARSALPPPGVPARDIEAPDEVVEDDGNWLVPDASRPRTALIEEALTEDVGGDDAIPLPARRSLVTVMRGELTRERSVPNSVAALSVSVASRSVVVRTILSVLEMNCTVDVPSLDSTWSKSGVSPFSTDSCGFNTIKHSSKRYSFGGVFFEEEEEEEEDVADILFDKRL